MKKSFMIVMGIIIFLAATSPAMAEKRSLLPRGTFISLYIINNPKDAGISWMMSNWLNQIKQSQRILPEEKQAFSDLFQVIPQHIEIGMISENTLAVVAPIASKDASAIEKVLDSLVKKWKPLKSVKYKDYMLYYRPEETKLRISAFTISKNHAILASNNNPIKQIIDALEDRNQSMMSDTVYKETLAFLPDKADITLFANNKDRKFSSTLRGWEKKWKMTIFLSAPYLDSIGASFDVIDGNRMKGVFVFKCSQKQKITDVVDDARFFGEALRRKFVKEKIKYTSMVTVKDTLVSLKFEISGLKPLWIKFFSQ